MKGTVLVYVCNIAVKPLSKFVLHNITLLVAYVNRTICLQLPPPLFLNCSPTHAPTHPPTYACTHTDPTQHARSFTRGSPYLCYNVVLEPCNTEQTQVSMTLVPPLPTYGTIITGISSDRGKYSVVLNNGTIVQTFSIEGQHFISQGSVKLATSSAYKIEASVNETYIAFTVRQGEGSFSLLEYQETAISPVLSSVPDFEIVCLGGGSLEDMNYVGRIKNAFSDYFSLTEERNFEMLSANETNTSRLINFNGDATISFQSLHKNAVRFSFDKRNSIGTEIFRMENDNGGMLSLSVVNDVLFANPGGFMCQYDVQDGRWHHYEVTITREPVVRVDYTVDCTIQCQLIVNTLTRAELEAFLSNPIEFARPHSSVGDDVARFDGCIQNFVFEQINGDVLEPNLEALPLLEEDFSTSIEGCDQCSEDFVSCPRTCLNRDFLRGDECDPTGEVLPFECSSLPMTTQFSRPPNTTSQPSTTQSPITTSQSSTTNTTPQPPQTNSVNAGVWAGIGIGIFLALLLFLVIILLIICLCRRKFGQEGFYRTNEIDSKNPQVVRYSASLRELSTEFIDVENKPNLAPVVHSNGHSKEFYL